MKQVIGKTQVEYGTKEWHEIGGVTKEAIKSMLKAGQNTYEKSIKAGKGKVQLRKTTSHHHDHYTIEVKKIVGEDIHKEYFVKVPTTIVSEFA